MVPLFAAGLVDVAFEVCQCCKHIVKGGRFCEIHLAHRLEITPQCRLTRCRRDESKGPRLREMVAGPRAAKELAFPCYDAVPEVVLVDGSGGGRVLCQGSRVRIVAGESIRRRFPSRPVIFRVEDRRFLPEAPLDFQGNDFATPVRKRIGQDLGNPRPNGVPANRLLIGERAELQLHRAFEVLEARRLR